MRHSYSFIRHIVPPTARTMLVAAIAALLWACSPAAQAQTVDTAFGGQLQRLVDDLQQQNELVGIAAAIAMPDGKQWQGAAGISDLAVPLRPDMLQGIGSITKTYVAALVLKLAEDGLLSLDDSLHRWLPHYANIDSTITIRQLLNHTGGVFNYLNNPAVNDSLLANLYRIWTPEEILTSFIQAGTFAPGKGWAYSNTGYILLGIIAEKASGVSVETAIRNRLLTPLGLAHTFFPVAEDLAGDVADPWSDITGDGSPDNIIGIPRDALHSIAGAAGAMYATPTDLVAWGRALYGGQVLTPASVSAMTTFRTVSFGLSNGYGLGAMRFRVAGKNVYGHGGNILGYSSILLYSPDDSITVAAIINETADATSVGLALMNLAMNRKASSVYQGDAAAQMALTVTSVRSTADGGSLTVEYDLQSSTPATLALYDLLGREVMTISDIPQDTHAVELDIRALPRGAYFWRLTAGNRAASGKVML